MMTNTRPEVNPNNRYCQQEAADILGVNRHTIRRWELEGLIKFAVRKAGRGKYTTGKQIIHCWEATYL